MKKFVFSFERLLKLKILKENNKKTELSSFISSVFKLQEEIDELSIKEFQVKTFYMNKKHLKISELIELAKLEKNNENVINLKKQQIQKLNNKINETKIQLLELMKERKVLESLKEKKKSNYLQEYSRAIDREANDVFLMRRGNV